LLPLEEIKINYRNNYIEQHGNSQQSKSHSLRRRGRRLVDNLHLSADKPCPEKISLVCMAHFKYNQHKPLFFKHFSGEAGYA
jgi:hypothetical protein